MLRVLAFIFFVTMCSGSAVGQLKLSGNVSDKGTGQPLVGASVQLSQGNAVALTDQFGHFSFDRLPAGTYSVGITYIGYSAEILTVDLRETTAIEARLERATIITDAVVVTATRSTEKTPTTFTTINKQELQQQNFGQDVPFLLNWTPSVVTTSDAGTGIGYTGIRIRGSDPTRVNITINGIPYNDSESLGTFWVDIPDIASSTESIQIQRGVGTSTNGAGAFGATVNLQTTARNDDPYAQITTSGGSFSTRRYSFGFGTGLLDDHWILEGRVSKIKSDGFIDRSASDLSSYYFSGTYYSSNTMIKALTFGGRERTYQSWYGVPESRLKNDVEAMYITAANEGWNEEQTENLLNSDSRTFNPYTYKNQIDQYQQDHFQLHVSQRLSPALTGNVAFHYTPGKGYYEEFQYDAELADYGLSEVIVDDDGDLADNDTISTTDLIRRRWLDNDFYGFTYSLYLDKKKWNAVVGGGWNRYEGDHFGEIIWAERAPIPMEYQYYFNTGDKRDFNSFVKVNYQVTEMLNAFADLQYRAIDYQANGVENEQGVVDIDASFKFVNPKLGFTYQVDDRQQLYASFAMAHREPVREDFINGGSPEPEELQNLEAGFRRTGGRFILNANYYLMLYENQLVLTGDLNDVGAPIRTNAGESYRTGIELEGAIKLHDNVQWNLNVTLSKNKINSFTEVLEDYGDNFDSYGIVKNVYRDTDIAFSPGVIAGSQLEFKPFPNTTVSLMTKYVGKQYLDNTTNDDRAIDPYLVNDLRVAYSWKPSFVKEINLSLLANNFLNEMYESNGYTWGYLAGATAFRENYYYPQAGRNFLVMVVVRI